MALYIPCAGSPLSLLAAKDTTGNNTGNFTAAFTASVLGNMPSRYEWYRATIDTATAGKTFTPAPISIYRNSKPVSFTFPAGGTEWDPSQAIPMTDGNELYFYFGLASTSTPVPRVTIWLRYDATDPANQSYVS